jgi:hypothetical protein
MSSKPVIRRIFNARDEHISDVSASFYELEPFDSILQALQYHQIKRRLPLCVKKTLHNRFMMPNIIYVVYAVGLLVIDFHQSFDSGLNSTLNTNSPSLSNGSKVLTSILEQPIQNDPFVNQLYIGKIQSCVVSRSVL